MASEIDHHDINVPAGQLERDERPGDASADDEHVATNISFQPRADTEYPVAAWPILSVGEGIAAVLDKEGVVVAGVRVGRVVFGPS